MFETIITILIFVAVIAFTVLLFGGWLVVMIVRALARLVLWPSQSTDARLTFTEVATDDAQCANDRCRASNPAAASFCRRCGTRMGAAQQEPVRRVAMW